LDLGIQADLILFHPYDHWGFAAMTQKECEDTLSYATRRLSAFPNLCWNLANEYDTMTHLERSWWPDFAALLHRENPYGHLLSHHHCITEWDFKNPDTTHVCLQTIRTFRIPSYRRRFRKPVVVDECGYEGDLPYAWGDLTGRELMRRIWTGYVLGGFVSYGETLLAPKDAGGCRMTAAQTPFSGGPRVGPSGARLFPGSRTSKPSWSPFRDPSTPARWTMTMTGKSCKGASWTRRRRAR
jgi:hypothetical protein